MSEAMATTPEQMVVAFQHDYKIWNDESFQNRRPDDVNAMKTAEQNYAALLKKYTQPDFHGEPVAYGSDASHDPAREKIIGKNIQQQEAVSPPSCRLSIIRPCMSTILSRRSKNGI